MTSAVSNITKGLLITNIDSSMSNNYKDNYYKLLNYNTFFCLKVKEDVNYDGSSFKSQVLTALIDQVNANCINSIRNCIQKTRSTEIDDNSCEKRTTQTILNYIRNVLNITAHSRMSEDLRLVCKSISECSKKLKEFLLMLAEKIDHECIKSL